MDKFKFNGFDLQLFGTPSAENLMLGKGSIFFNRYDPATASYTGERHLGNCTEFTFGNTADVAKKYSSMDHRAALYKAYNKSLKSSGKVVMDEFDPYNVAMILLGENSVVNQVAGAVAAGSPEKYPAVRRSQMIKLGSYNAAGVAQPENAQKFNIDPATLVVKDSTGTTTYQKNRDYLVVNAGAGVIMVPDTVQCSIPNTTVGVDLMISYGYGNAVLPQIVGGTNLRIEGYLRFVGDPILGRAYEGEFWKVTIMPEGDVTFIGEDLANMNFSFDCEDDSMNHPDDPYARLLFK